MISNMLKTFEYSVFALGMFFIPFEQMWITSRTQEVTPKGQTPVYWDEQVAAIKQKEWFEKNGLVSLILFVCLACILMCLYHLHINEKTMKTGKKITWLLRPGADAGLWCTLQLPVALVVGCLIHKVHITHLYLSATIISVGLLATSLFLLIWVHMYNLGDEKFSCYSNIWCLLPTLGCGIALYKFVGINLVMAYVLSGITQLVFIHFVLHLPSLCQGNFTVGEALLVSQGITVFLATCCVSLIICITELLPTRGPVLSTVGVSESAHFLQGVLLGVAVVIVVLYYFPIMRTTALFYSLAIPAGSSVAYVTTYLLLKSEPLTWLLYFLLSDKVKLILLFVWVLCTSLAIFFVVSMSVLYSVWKNSLRKQNTTIIRKYFHVIVLFIFVPGLMLDKELLYLATGIALGAFLLVECIRVCRIPPFGWAINKSFAMFEDGKDTGVLVLTHIYLLIGCSIPLWIFPQSLKNSSFHLSLFSGILSLGVGDTVASVVGSSFGKFKIPGTKKTFEGTLSAIVVQMLVSFLWSLWNSKLWNNYIMIGVFTIFSCVMEAVTLQIDNLVLPFFLYTMLVAIL